MLASLITSCLEKPWEDQAMCQFDSFPNFFIDGKFPFDVNFHYEFFLCYWKSIFFKLEEKYCSSYHQELNLCPWYFLFFETKRTWLINPQRQLAPAVGKSSVSAFRNKTNAIQKLDDGHCGTSVMPRDSVSMVTPTCIQWLNTGSLEYETIYSTWFFGNKISCRCFLQKLRAIGHYLKWQKW